MPHYTTDTAAQAAELVDRLPHGEHFVCLIQDGAQWRVVTRWEPYPNPFAPDTVTR